MSQLVVEIFAGPFAGIIETPEFVGIFNNPQESCHAIASVCIMAIPGYLKWLRKSAVVVKYFDADVLLYFLKILY